MAKFATGKYSQRISDRSGAAFPYKEMVKEWNGSIVHISEFEPKHPQLEPLKNITDPEAIPLAKPQIASVTVYPPTDGINTPKFQSTGMQPSTHVSADTRMQTILGRVTVSIS